MCGLSCGASLWCSIAAASSLLPVLEEKHKHRERMLSRVPQETACSLMCPLCSRCSLFSALYSMLSFVFFECGPPSGLRLPCGVVCPSCGVRAESGSPNSPPTCAVFPLVLLAFSFGVVCFFLWFAWVSIGLAWFSLWCCCVFVLLGILCFA